MPLGRPKPKSENSETTTLIIQPGGRFPVRDLARFVRVENVCAAHVFGREEEVVRLLGRGTRIQAVTRRGAPTQRVSLTPRRAC